MSVQTSYTNAKIKPTSIEPTSIETTSIETTSNKPTSVQKASYTFPCSDTFEQFVPLPSQMIVTELTKPILQGIPAIFNGKSLKQQEQLISHLIYQGLTTSETSKTPPSSS